MEVELLFLTLSPNNLDACAALAQNAPDPWTREGLERAMEDANYRCFVAAERGGAPVGLAIFLALPGSGTADLAQVVVAPGMRRRGVAKALLLHGLACMQGQGAGQVLLEVRAANTGAIALYKGLGFRVLARRPGMYAHPAEDGLLMGRDLRVAEKPV